MSDINLPQVIIYSDGACLGNPGPGGWGAVIIADGERRELCAGYCLTTNNRMEILGATVALESLPKPARVRLYTDSEYVVNAMTKGWAKSWKKNGWRRSNKAPALNPDLWQRMLDACARHDVTFQWVKGHASNAENNRCDALANGIAHERGLPEDSGYHPSSQKRLF